MRISRLLRYLVLMAFGGMLILSLHILLDFLPDLEGSHTGINFQSQQLYPKHVPKPVSYTTRITLNLNISEESLIRERHRYDIKPVHLQVGADFLEPGNRYFIYRCDTGKMAVCNSWLDMFVGMETAYLIANLTGRKFLAEIHGHPCRLDDYISPRHVNWSFSPPFHQVLNKGMAGVGLRLMDNNYPFHNNLYKTNLTEFAQPNFDYIYFKSNVDSVYGFQNSLLYQDQLAWMRGLRKDRIHSFLFQRLFTLAQPLRKRLEMFLYSILPSDQHKLLCIDLTQGNISRGSSFSSQKLSMVWNFLNQHSKTGIHRIFLLTDDWEILRQAKREAFKDRLIESPIFFSRTEDHMLQMCDKLEAEIFHQHLMVDCDLLVVTTYGIGRLAAYIRGTDDGLYCLMENGRIHLCSASSFTELYSIHT